MSASLGFEQYLRTIETASGRLVADLEDVGLSAPVPTCPSWNGRALLAHQAVVHRWATTQVAGTDPKSVPTQTVLRKQCDDLPCYFRAGVVALVDAPDHADPDVVAGPFLNNAPDHCVFWARRQAHETTIHGVDALATRTGRPPGAEGCAITRGVALDGIDELLAGFYTRGASRLFVGEEFDIVVAPSDSDRCWTMHVGTTNTVIEGHTEAAATVLRLTGTSAELYLGLWNRGDELRSDGDDQLIDRWRRAHRIRWS